VRCPGVCGKGSLRQRPSAPLSDPSHSSSFIADSVSVQFDVTAPVSIDSLSRLGSQAI
jgi:hypothetical protein